MIARVNAIKAALGLPESIVGALPIAGAAWLAMGFPPDTRARPDPHRSNEATTGNGTAEMKPHQPSGPLA